MPGKDDTSSKPETGATHDAANAECPWNDPETLMHPATRGLDCTCPVNAGVRDPEQAPTAKTFTYSSRSAVFEDADGDPLCVVEWELLERVVEWAVSRGLGADAPAPVTLETTEERDLWLREHDRAFSWYGEPSKPTPREHADDFIRAWRERCAQADDAPVDRYAEGWANCREVVLGELDSAGYTNAMQTVERQVEERWSPPRCAPGASDSPGWSSNIRDEWGSGRMLEGVSGEDFTAAMGRLVGDKLSDGRPTEPGWWWVDRGKGKGMEPCHVTKSVGGELGLAGLGLDYYAAHHGYTWGGRCARETATPEPAAWVASAVHNEKRAKATEARLDELTRAVEDAVLWMDTGADWSDHEGPGPRLRAALDAAKGDA